MSQLDHIAIAGPDLAALVAHFQDLTGVQPVKGGRHEGQGTANYLIGLGEGSYIELIGPDPDQPDPAEPRPLGVDDVTRPTITGWAARPDHLDATIAAAREAGYDPGQARDMDRRTPDGEVIAWRLTMPTGQFDGVIPFLIDWLDTTHPSGGLPQVTLRTFTITHPDTDGVRSALAAVGALGPVSAVKQGEPSISIELDTPRGRVRIG